MNLFMTSLGWIKLSPITIVFSIVGLAFVLFIGYAFLKGQSQWDKHTEDIDWMEGKDIW